MDNIGKKYFWRLNQAKNMQTPIGRICIFTGWLFMGLGLLWVGYAMTHGIGPSGTNFLFARMQMSPILLAILGAIMNALGNQANDARRCVEIAYLQAQHIEFFGELLDTTDDEPPAS